MVKRLLLLAVFAGPMVAQAQVNPDSVKHANDCRLAVQVLTRGRPAVKTDWAIRQMRSCPNTAGELANAIQDARASRDTTYLNRLTAPTDWLRDGAIFTAASGLLRDDAATSEARVFAARVLMWAYVPGQEIQYGHLVDTDLDGDWTCGGLGPSLHGEIVRGTPLPADWPDRARQLGESVASDEREPLAVRQAAACLAVVVPFPHVRRTR